jgi:outer membrane lipopolysaccharide assembly protein LptE/RlpB
VNYRIASLISSLCLGIILCYLSGCGFHLNGTHHTAEDFSSIRVQLAKEPSFGNFYRAFYALSKQSGVVIVSRQVSPLALPSDTLLLWLHEPTFQERPLSYSSDGQANYVMIELTLSYELHDSKGHVLSASPITLARPMSIAPNALLNNDSQRTLVREALIQKACVQLLQRLNAHAKTLP